MQMIEKATWKRCDSSLERRAIESKKHTANSPGKKMKGQKTKEN